MILATSVLAGLLLVVADRFAAGNQANSAEVYSSRRRFHRSTQTSHS